MTSLLCVKLINEIFFFRIDEDDSISWTFLLGESVRPTSCVWVNIVQYLQSNHLDSQRLEYGTSNGKKEKNIIIICEFRARARERLTVTKHHIVHNQFQIAAKQTNQKQFLLIVNHSFPPFNFYIVENWNSKRRNMCQTATKFHSSKCPELPYAFLCIVHHTDIINLNEK